MYNRRSDMACQIVSQESKLLALDSRHPFRIASHDFRSAIHEAYPGFKTAEAVTVCCPLQPGGQAIEEHIWPGPPQFTDHLLHSLQLATSQGEALHHGHALMRNVDPQVGIAVGRAKNSL